MNDRGVISYPIPLYQNVPIQPLFYQPRLFFISAISLGFTTTITTTLNMDYAIGQEIRLNIPSSFGSIQLNQKTGFVIDIPALDQVTVNINSIGADPYIASSAATPAQIVAIGDVNNGQINSNGPQMLTYIPGSFINISPL